MPVTLRPVVVDDRPFLLGLYRAVRAEEFAALDAPTHVVQGLLDQQYAAREARRVSNAPDADDLAIEVGDHGVGRLVIDRRPDGIRIIDIEVLPADQGRGIGTSVLRRVLDEADAVGAPVSLHVVSTSPARRLYERLGFEPVSADGAGEGLHVLMERRPVV